MTATGDTAPSITRHAFPGRPASLCPRPKSIGFPRSEKAVVANIIRWPDPKLMGHVGMIAMEGAEYRPSVLLRRIAAVFGLAAVTVLSLGACASNNESASPAESTLASPAEPAIAPTTTGAPASTGSAPWTPRTFEPPGPDGPVDSGFGKYDDAENKLVTANASWRSPDNLVVGRRQPIGLAIRSARLTSQVNDWVQTLPGTDRPAGQIRVSPNATARLVASSADVEVEPSWSQNQSTGSNIDLDFSWFVTPKKAVSDLVLTAYVEVHLEGIPPPYDVKSTPINLPITVLWPPTSVAGLSDATARSPSTAAQILDWFSANWKTWAPIIGIPSLAGIAGSILKKTRLGAWIMKKIRRNRQAPPVAAQEASVTQAPPSDRSDSPVEPEHDPAR